MAGAPSLASRLSARRHKTRAGSREAYRAHSRRRAVRALRPTVPSSQTAQARLAAPRSRRIARKVSSGDLAESLAPDPLEGRVGNAAAALERARGRSKG